MGVSLLDDMMSNASTQRGEVNAKRSLGNAYQPFRYRFVDPIGDKTFDPFAEIAVAAGCRPCGLRGVHGS
jgi:hypothetical protein